jgi:hypothetical protein
MAGKISEMTQLTTADGTERREVSWWDGAAWLTRSLTPLVERYFHKRGGKPNPTIYYNLAAHYYPTMVVPAASSGTLAVQANTIYLIPFSPGKDVTLSELLCRVTTAGLAGKLGRMAIYLGDPDTGGPTGFPLYDSGTFAVDVIGIKTFNPALAVKCGDEHHLAFWSDGAPTVNAYTPFPLCGIRLNASGITTLGGLVGSLAFGAWPSGSATSWASGSVQGTIFPAVCCR